MASSKTEPKEDRLEKWIANGLPNGSWSRIMGTQFYEQTFNGTYKLGDVDFIVWQASTSGVFFIEAKDLDNYKPKSPAEEGFSKQVLKKLFNAFVLIQNQTNQTSIWQEQIRINGVNDKDWSWKIMFVINLNPLFIEGLDALRTQFRDRHLPSLVELLGYGPMIGDKLNRIIFLTPNLARDQFPDLFPTAYDAAPQP